MTSRYDDLKKIPKEPAARMLALANAKLRTRLKSPANASVGDVLKELEQAGAGIDQLRLLSVALPPRERVWWGCLAARDIIGDQAEAVPLSLATSEKWVFSPTEENREAARASVEVADIDDDSILCATAVSQCDGKLGPGDLSKFEAPPGGAAAAVFGINVISLGLPDTNLIERQNLLINRALDIARGGDGRLGAKSEPDKGSAKP